MKQETDSLASHNHINRTYARRFLMANASIEQFVDHSQDPNEIICPLCNGNHGNNSNCQRSE